MAPNAEIIGHFNGHNSDSSRNGAFIVGIGHYYPPYTNALEDIESHLAKFCDMNTPAMKKLLQVNRNTGIKERPNIISRDDPLFNRSEPPTIADLDHIFRTRAVDLVVKACRKAISDWGGSAAAITHTVAATATNAGSPGYDLLVNEKLRVRPEAQRLFVSGLGCAGGLATIRTAAMIANDATLRGRPARVLGFSCDVTSTNVRCDLMMLNENPEETRVSMALFSDAAGAFVLCNQLALEDGEEGAIYSVLDWEGGVLPGTQNDEQCLVNPLGFRSFMSPNMPTVTSNAVEPTLAKMLDRNAWQRSEDEKRLGAADLDWVLHPAGLAVLEKVRENLKLEDGQMRASFDVYENKGNSSGPTVLIVLDRLRKMGEGRDNVIACAFGPGVCLEMVSMKRCRN
ncbi:hypothetical protein AJ79_02312 [Helicocarpus griseus UAMH5409]|uniref:Chalcone synthase n=1 Tax=Helicocarpus griseus UAMH5409 TaxID=1447875 RepID=A0A2B7Y2N2_9EURO|nr:hypothetical protein AJ79_02312 [Helicocarpus griseus UAMH5409]